MFISSETIYASLLKYIMIKFEDGLALKNIEMGVEEKAELIVALYNEFVVGKINYDLIDKTISATLSVHKKNKP